MMNISGEKITKFKEDDVLMNKIFHVFNVQDNSGNTKLTENILSLIHKEKSIKSDESLILKSKNGKEIPISYNIYTIKDSEDKAYGIVFTFKDITEKIAQEKELNHITYHDGLTGVYNRNFFNMEIKSIDIADNLPISIIMGDVNGLKLTNDAFGHLMGDKLLISAANIMKTVCRNKDIIVRWGGDEFIILLPRTKSEDVKKVVKEIKNECKKYDKEIINISISLGYDTKYNKDDDILKSISYAEEMMYKVKMLESKSVKSRTLKIIVNTLYEKSRLADIHSRNISKVCEQVGKSMEMSEDKISELKILGDIHDIGKIGISECILNKEGKLNDEEWAEMKKHPQIGYHIISSSNDLSFLSEAVLSHHEGITAQDILKGLKVMKFHLWLES
ncbi:MAG: PAS domain S-box/diguanylate cyclase (GGDEF) domain-containing protein [Clostridium sp. Maddingley MBC34-26]|nr:MAG: PAS domain S-box/diguanylate cyclase (GGDEF) domain-containing protein [Clostridium sp. Maddingley MBC34-26]